MVGCAKWVPHFVPSPAFSFVSTNAMFDNMQSGPYLVRFVTVYPGAF